MSRKRSYDFDPRLRPFAEAIAELLAAQEIRLAESRRTIDVAARGLEVAEREIAALSGESPNDGRRKRKREAGT